MPQVNKTPDYRFAQSGNHVVNPEWPNPFKAGDGPARRCGRDIASPQQTGHIREA